MKDRLARLRAELGGSGQTGFLPTRLASVRLFWSDHRLPRMPLAYDPGIAVIVSGRKIGFLNGSRFVYDAGSYLAVGLPVCFDCETHATPDRPLIGLFLNADQAMLQELSAGLAETRDARPAGQTTLGVEPLKLTMPMREAVTRLADQLSDDAEAQLLSPATLREIFFHALQDRHGQALLAQTRPDRPEARIAALLRRIESTGDRPPSVEEMAQAVGMSPASFHRHFRAAFGASPLQYLKLRRLIRARTLLADHGSSVAEAAHATGYASAAQFSRDFRTYFGEPPSAVHQNAA
ncbi:MAG: AraC family transcriptional regulator [Hyphomonas sp.]|nr:AraC family transcriptional regulator [Hyphomonas sp.]